MPVFGLVFLLGGALLIRQLAVGRAVDIPVDARDAFTALVRGDLDGVASVGARRGASAGNGVFDDGSQSGDPNLIAARQSSGTAGQSATIATAQKLAAAANNRYILGTSGPSSYDCSGLAWRTLRELGVYKGARFTTATFERVAPKFATRTETPSPGDIVIWPNHHMGFYAGPDRLYSAYNHAQGIKFTKISSDSKSKGEPHYWRIGA